MATRRTSVKNRPLNRDFPDVENTNPNDPDNWEEVSDDNGVQERFEVGDVKEGYYVKTATIELPEHLHKPLDDGSIQSTANLIVFSSTSDNQNRWSVWQTYQLGQVDWQAGEYYRIACVDERKATQGDVKVFSIKKRKS